MSSYPSRGYRRSSNPGSFQHGGAGQPGPRPTPVPANDNPPPRLPANDNGQGKLSRRNAALLGNRYVDLGLWVGRYAFRYFINGSEAASSAYSNPAGWYLLFECPGGFDPIYMQWTQRIADPTPFCFTNQSLPVYEYPDAPKDAPVNAASNTAYQLFKYDFCVGSPEGTPAEACLPSLRSGRVYQMWQLPEGVDGRDENPLPKNLPSLPAVIPEGNPLENPDFLPIFREVVLPRPLPWSQVSQNQRQKENLMAWQSPTPYRPRPVPVQVEVIAPEVYLGPKPFAPNAPARQQMAPFLRNLGGYHKQKPAGRGTKERKFILAPNQRSPVGLAMNAVTETADFVDALYYAIPVALRPHWPNGKVRKLGVSDKMAQIYLHFGQIDMQKAYNNLLDNQIGDAIGGIAGKLNAKALRAFHKNTGYTFATGLRQPKLGGH